MTYLVTQTVSFSSFDSCHNLFSGLNDALSWVVRLMDVGICTKATIYREIRKVAELDVTEGGVNIRLFINQALTKGTLHLDDSIFSQPDKKINISIEYPVLVGAKEESED